MVYVTPDQTAKTVANFLWQGYISMEPGNLVLAKADTYKRRRKVKDQWEKKPYKVECRIG